MIRLVNLLFATTSSFVPNKSSVLTNRISSDTVKRPSTQNIKKMMLVSSEGAEMRQTEFFWVFGYGSLIWKVWPYHKYAKCAPLNFFGHVKRPKPSAHKLLPVFSLRLFSTPAVFLEALKTGIEGFGRFDLFHQSVCFLFYKWMKNRTGIHRSSRSSQRSWASCHSYI